jgi:lipase chaperone LimK
MRTASFIDALLDNKFVLVLLGAGAMAIAVYGVVLWQRPAPESAPAPTRAGSWNDAVGPGLLSGAGGNMPALAMQDMRDVKIAVDGSGHLAPDRALLKLMNEFLLNAKLSERQALEQQLRNMLRQRLDQPAAGEADRLVTAYLAYLQAESQLLARERFTQADPNGLSDQEVKHLLAWQRERAELRERMLGTAAATAWFADEDGNCAAALNDWEKQLAPPADNDSAEQWSRRRNGDRLAAQRNEDAQACAARIAESVAAPRG